MISAMKFSRMLSKTVLCHQQRSFGTTAAKLASSSPRPSLAPMPRILPPASPPPRSGLRKSWDSGNILIALGWTGLAVFALDRYLQYTDRQDAKNMVGMLSEETRQKRQILLEEWKDKPTLYKCVIKESYKMGGSHGLKDVQVNDIVEVLREGVGPGESYNLCRTRDEQGHVKSIGWYPIGFMENAETASFWDRFRRRKVN